MVDKRTITFTHEVIVEEQFCSKHCEYLGKTPAGPDPYRYYCIKTMGAEGIIIARLNTININ